MEKVKIKNCVKKETAKGVFYTIELEDGRTGISSQNLIEFIGQEKEFVIKEGKLYNNKMQYYFNLPKGNKGKGFFQKDYTFEKRKVALECAISHCSKNPELKTKDILECTEKFYEFLNSK